MTRGPSLEMDLYRSIEIGNKCENQAYAQALYAALCNTTWCRIDTMELLKGSGWSCSWRFAGGVVARIRDAYEAGDYMDFYCSGSNDGAVPEGVVTDEIAADLRSIGWMQIRE